MSAAIRVVVADDYPIVIEGIKNVLAADPSLVLAGVATLFDEVPGVLQKARPDVLVLDLLGMGDSILSLMQYLGREHPRLAVLIFSSTLDYATELLELGVRGYVTKTEMAGYLVQGITAVVRGELYLSPMVTRHLEQSQPGAPLTPRELYALKLYDSGMETPEIAVQMHIKNHSVQNLFNSMFVKTGCKGRRQLREWYRRMYGSSSDNEGT